MDDKMPENLEEIETSYEEALEKKMPQPRNRAERRALRKKDHDDVDEGDQDLDAGVEPVDEGIPLHVLAEGDV